MFHTEEGATAELEPAPKGRDAVVDDHAARKRAAVELIRGHETALRSTSRRYSICAEDAEDAYQRGIEILLSKAPTTDLRQLLPWSRTVIKHESLAIRKSRERVLSRPPRSPLDEDAEDWVNLIPYDGQGPDDRVVGREKVARSREALGQLKPQELKALTQLAEGYSYAEIADLNGWTHTKVNRCLAEGRQRFRAVFGESEAGERCLELEHLISACCEGEADASGRRQVEDHLAVCGHCRATLRAYKAAPRAAAALVPAVPVGTALLERFQEAVVSTQLRFQGLGGASDSAGAIAASGGTRGAGVAAIAKAATLCLGTAGSTAACVVAGVLPAPALLDGREQRAKQEKPMAETHRVVSAPRSAIVAVDESVEGRPEINREPVKRDPEPVEVQRPQPEPDPPPPPSPTEAEFTPEAAGTPVAPAAAPPPSSPAPSRQGGAGAVPLGGHGEFGP